MSPFLVQCNFPDEDAPIHKVRSLSLEGHPLATVPIADLLDVGDDNGAAILQPLCVGSTDHVLW